MKKKYKMIIFDCDGTLVESEVVINSVASQILAEMGYDKYTEDYCVEHFGGISAKEMSKSLLKEIGPNFDSKTFDEKNFSATKKALDLRAVAMNNAEHLLEKLKDFPKCVASNGQRDWVITSLRKTNLMQYFNMDSIFTYEDVLEAKPSPKLFLYAAEKMGFKPEDCLVIEDSKVGLQAAQNANIDSILIKPESRDIYFNPAHHNPIAVIKDLSEVLLYL